MIEVSDAVFSDGQEAYGRGDKKAASPYDIGSTLSIIWLAGWDEAERYANRIAVRVSI
jgi:hypothetical protein